MPFPSGSTATLFLEQDRRVVESPFLPPLLTRDIIFLCQFQTFPFMLLNQRQDCSGVFPFYLGTLRIGADSSPDNPSVIADGLVVYHRLTPIYLEQSPSLQSTSNIK